uniref:DNA-directed RNA polymerase I subunit RPA43 n=1 Tax=Peronospora matthiolae TaxID=2874970 RepID=A0AAV1TRL7_9STRA
MVLSAFVLCKVRHNVSLLPCHSMEPRVGIEQDLAEQLMHYSDPLQGVILSFSNVQLDRPYGAIVNEMPFIHCKVLADALVFRPRKGMELRGIVNKIGSNHVGMLFAGVFNGSVAEAELPKGYVHNYAQDCWLGEDGSSISVADEVNVKVLRVHVAGGMIAIEATMRHVDTKAVNALSVKKVKRSTHLNLAAGEPVTKSVKQKKSKRVKGAEGLENKKVKKVKKAKKTKEADEVKKKKVRKAKDDMETESAPAEDLSAEKEEKRSKKRKQKEKVMKKPSKHKVEDAKKKEKHKKSKHD